MIDWQQRKFKECRTLAINGTAIHYFQNTKTENLDVLPREDIKNNLIKMAFRSPYSTLN